MESAKIQISIKLLERLAGVKRDDPPGARRQQRGSGGQHGGGGSGGLPPLLAGRLGPPLVPGELGATFSLEPEVRSALATSRRVGALLLKAEEQEMAAVAAAADDLLKREYSAPKREVPCQAQRDACVACYQEHKQDAWQCSDLVDSYAACATAAYESAAAV